MTIKSATVSDPVRVFPPITLAPPPLTRVIDEAVLVIAEARVDCCAREEYLRTVIVYLSGEVDARGILLLLSLCLFCKSLRVESKDLTHDKTCAIVRTLGINFICLWTCLSRTCWVKEGK